MPELDESYTPCEFCGRDDVPTTLIADPFAEEINGDDTEHWICDDCYQASCWEI